LGSKDIAVYEDILTTDTLTVYAEQDFEGHIGTKDALEQLVWGKPYDKRSAHAYWYALIALTDYAGERLPGTHEIKLGYETDLINGYLGTDFGIKLNIEEILINEHTPFDLPKVQDWPLAGLLDETALIRLQEQLKAITISSEMLEQLAEEDDEKEMAYDSIKQLQENVDYCLANELTMLSFCH